MKLKQYRLRLDLTQEDMAKALNIKRATYANYENGNTEPTINILKQLAEFFHITTDELLERENTNIIDKGLLSQTELDILEIMKTLNSNNLDKLEAYATALYSTQKDQETIIKRIKG